MKNKDKEKEKIKENQVEEDETKEKLKQNRWTASMDSVLLDTLEEQARQGKKHGNSWDHKVWKIVIDAIYQQTDVLVERKNIDSRLRSMKSEYRSYTELCGISGFGMDHARKTVDASKESWLELFKNPVSREKYSKFRDRCIKWDYDQLSIVIGNYHATGSYAIDGLDCIDVTDDGGGSSDFREVEDDTDMDSVEKTSTPSKRPLPSLEKRKHGKKTRQADEVKEMISGMSEELARLSRTIDPMAFGRNLYDALSKMTGFSARYLDVALGILRKDPVEATSWICLKRSTGLHGRIDWKVWNLMSIILFQKSTFPNLILLYKMKKSI